MKPRVH